MGAPYSAQAHHGTVEPVQRLLYGVIPEDWGIYQRLALAVPSRLGLYVPDLARGYAEAGIPLHLLIDAVAPGGPTVTLYGEPGGDAYRLLGAGRFGSRLVLPQPFGLALDTGEFPES